MCLSLPTRALLVGLFVAAGATLSSCGEKAGPTRSAAPTANAPSSGSAPSGPAQSATGPVVAGRPSRESPWFDGFPKKQVTLKPGDRVVAGVPDSKALYLYVGTIKSVEGETATVEIGTNMLIERAPGALLSPLPTGASKAGDLGAGIQNAAGKFELGIVGEPTKDGKPGHIDLHFGQGLGKIERMSCDAVFPLVGGAEPLTVVVFDHPDGRPERGVVVAKEGGKVVVKDAGSGGMILDAGAVRPVAIKQGYKAGDKVQAWSYGIGYKPGTVTAVEKAGELYKVKSTRVVDESEDTFYFTELAP